MAEHRPTAADKRAVVERARGCCEYCRSQECFATQAFAIEHVEPESAGGETCLDNLALSCQGCNNHKYNKQTGIDPVTGQPASLFNPRRQEWGEHFAWNNACNLIVGLTPTGRATVDTLHLNRPGLVNLRQILFAVGRHPP
jgi:5-methylcytosine-specific restriction endonuclease McrA